MKYTNNHNLPLPVKVWLESDSYDYHPGIYSATRLMKPVRMVVLEKRFDDKLEIDIADEIAKRYGTALHDSFEAVEIPNATQEKRKFCKWNDEHRIWIRADETDGEISGKPDILMNIPDGSVDLWDIKSTSVWTYIFGKRDEEHRIQLSIYRLIEAGNGSQVNDNGTIIYLFTDWSKSRARQGNDYPPIRIVVKEIDLMSLDETNRYILDRIALFDSHMDTPEPELPLCSREELWTKPDKWAIMKEGRKTAVKLHDSEKDAKEHFLSLDNKHSIIHRPGTVNRCDYCAVTKWCSQYADLVAQGLVNGE